MADLDELVRYCDTRLETATFDDYCPNGLQIEATREVRRIVSGVTASLALIEAAADADADLLLVHHGYFWKGEAAPLVGMKGRRVRRLLAADINLIAYHLPLDAHPELGNNRQLGLRLGLVEAAPVEGEGGLIWRGVLAEPMAPASFAAHVEAVLGRAPSWIDGGSSSLRRLAWCTGAAQGLIDRAAALGCDGYLSGEISEPTVHVAREQGLHYFAAGHHATERYGVQALGAELAATFGLEHRFIDVDNPA